MAQTRQFSKQSVEWTRSCCSRGGWKQNCCAWPTWDRGGGAAFRVGASRGGSGEFAVNCKKVDTAETALSGLVDYRTWGEGVVCIVGSNPPSPP